MAITVLRASLGRRLGSAALGLLLAAAPGWGQDAPPPAADAPPPAPLPGAGAVDRLATVTYPAIQAAPTPPAEPPYGGPLHERQKLMGDWLGTRGTLRDHGITWDISSTNYYSGVTSGGLDQNFQFGGRGDIMLHVDGDKAGLWQGLFIDLHGETLYGQSANGLTGALMPINLSQMLPNPNSPVTALTRVKVTQALSENFVVFLGKLNLLDEFNQPFTGGARGTNGFMNAAMVFNPVYGRTVPYSTYGGGFAVLKNFEPVFTVMVLDPNNTPTVTGFDTFFDRGASIVSSINLPTNFFGKPGHQGITGTYSNSRYTALDDMPYFLVQRLRGELPTLPQETGSWSIGYAFDQTIWMDPCNPKRAWGLFGNAGISDGNPNPIRWAANIGVGGSSPFKSRKYDSFGVGYYYVGLSDSFKNFAPRIVPMRDEEGVELFYNVGISPWFHITPDLQINTPFRAGVDTSVNFSLRAKIDF